MKVCDILHPDYKRLIVLWSKYRCVFEGGVAFINKYLQPFSSREDNKDFAIRKSLTYAPAHAKAAIMEIKNAIFQRMPDIKRSSGTQSYKEAVAGRNKGVDFNGNTMNGFIGRLVLPDLLSLGKIGVYIDRHPLPEQPSKADVQSRAPYLYTYAAEDIRSWAIDPDTQTLMSLLLCDTIDDIDPDTGLVVGVNRRYRLLKKNADGVELAFFDRDGLSVQIIQLNLMEIPFVLFELSHSLLTDIADHQIALLNLASSDMNYALKGNFPFYTEQYDPLAEQTFVRQAIDDIPDDNVDALGEGTAGEAQDAAIAKNLAVRVGVAQGRRYPKGLGAPAFIAPPIAPLTASMEKQEQIKREILQLVNLAVSTLRPSRASAESKREDQKGLEAGLSYIGLELEYGERQLQQIWGMYEHEKTDPSISYPQNYSLRTEESRRKEADDLLKLLPMLPSAMYQREVAKEIAEITLGHRVTDEKLQEIRDEIDASKVIVTDPEVINMDIENGLVSVETASQARLYPKDDVEKAKKEHAERLARINAAQSNPAARGTVDLDSDPNPAEEKEKSRQTDKDGVPSDKTRGGGK